MIPSEFDIAGRTVIVTGAARGIGAGIVKVLARAGAGVLVTALTERYLKPLGEELKAEGHDVETLVADATNAEDWQRTTDVALSRWGRVDALVNNLGDAIRGNLVPLAESEYDTSLSEEEWQRVVGINLTHAFLGCRAIGPHFIEKRKGKVINISGIAARRGSPGMLAYSVAKAGLVRFTQTVAQEWAPYGITVNSIGPGYFPDPEHGDPEKIAHARKQALRTVPLGRVGEPVEVGFLALYLISDASNYLTGETIYLDGGVSSA